MQKKILIGILVLITISTLFTTFDASFNEVNTDFNEFIDSKQKIAGFQTKDYPLTNSRVNEESVKILFDEAHTNFVAGGFAPGPVSMMGGFLNTLGFEADVNLDQNLTEIDLSNYDILVICFPQFELNNLEIDAVLQFVTNGGSLLLSGFASGYPMYLLSSTLNPLSKVFNVTFVDTFQAPKVITSFEDAPITNNLSKVYITDVGKFTIDPGADVQIVANLSPDSPAFAYRTFEEGKVFFSTTTNMFANLKGPDTENHFQFVANVFNWLGNRPITEVSDPGWMNVPIRKEYTTTEVERGEYMMLVGDTHLHSSEGSSDSGEPIINQIERARVCDYDFMSITDHQSDTPDLSWPVAKEYVEAQNITDLTILYGVEGDTITGHHHTCIGLTEIITPGQLHTSEEWPSVIDTYHQQGGLVFKAHPLNVLSTVFIDYLNHIDESGIDGIELVGAGFFGEDEGGLGEAALIYPFTGGSDAHSSFNVNRTITIVFAENNSQEAILDALINRRTVIIDNFQTSGEVYPIELVIGDQQWLDEFNYRNSTAREQYSLISEVVSNASAAGWDVSVANSLLSNLESVLYNHNYAKALRICQEIIESLYTITLSNIDTFHQVSDTINIDISVVNPSGTTMNFIVKAELINEDYKTIIESSEISIIQGNLGELSLQIPANIPKTGDYPLNIEIIINNTIYKKSFNLNIEVDTSPPNINILTPTSGESFLPGDDISVSWEGTDDLTSISNYSIFLDDSFKAIQNTTSIILSDLSIGTHTVKVIATDIAGNSAEDEVTFEVEEVVVTTTTTTTIPTTNGTTPGLTNLVFFIAFFFLIGVKKNRKK